MRQEPSSIAGIHASGAHPQHNHVWPVLVQKFGSLASALGNHHFGFWPIVVEAQGGAFNYFLAGFDDQNLHLFWTPFGRFLLFLKTLNIYNSGLRYGDSSRCLRDLPTGSGDGPQTPVVLLPAVTEDVEVTFAPSAPGPSRMCFRSPAATPLKACAGTSARNGRRDRATPFAADRRHPVYGTSEEVVERIQRYKEGLGISGPVLQMNYGGQVPNELVLRSIRQLTERVMPEFK